MPRERIELPLPVPKTGALSIKLSRLLLRYISPDKASRQWFFSQKRRIIAIVIPNFLYMQEITTKQVKAAALLMLGIAALAFVYQYGRSLDQTYPNRTFSVQGEADIETPNDIAFFTATVTTEGEGEVALLQSENTEKMNRINAFLGEQGIDKRDLKTTNYTMNPRYNYPSCPSGTITCPPPTINGYTITQSLEVKVRQTDKVGDLLTGIVAAGANSVSGVSFVTDDDNAARLEARKQAFADAREKAFETAKAGGFRVGKMVTFYEDNMSPVEPMREGMGGDMTLSAKAMPAPVIEPGVSKGKLQVTLTYEIR